MADSNSAPKSGKRIGKQQNLSAKSKGASAESTISKSHSQVDPGSTILSSRGDGAATKPAAGENALPANQSSPAKTVQLSLAEFATLAHGLEHGRYRPRALVPGQRVDRYQIIEEIGRGGFSVVYSAKHVYLGHKVALKTLVVHDSQAEGAVRFLREARVPALLRNPNVVRVLDADIKDDLPYIILEFIEGDTLQRVLKERGSLTMQRSMDLLEEIGGVLREQEEVGVLHRDIKPGNIILRADGRFCLFDYGLVGVTEGSAASALNDSFLENATRAGSLFGTLKYMPAEQAHGESDRRSDLFGLGITAWECLAGRPARANMSTEKMIQILKEPLPRLTALKPQAPVGLEKIVSSLVAVARDDRYPSANDFLSDLQTFRYSGRQPRGAMSGAAFIAMPFSRRFASIYGAIEEACLRTRLRPVRTDQVVFSNNIWSEIVQNIEGAKVVIADFTPVNSERHPNPNVVTEAAHARAIGRPLILLTQGTPEQLPFDWRQTPVVRYSSIRRGLNKLVTDLEHHVRQLISPRSTQNPPDKTK